MKHFAWIALSAGLLSGLLGQGSFGHQLLVVGAGVYLLGPTFCCLALVAMLSIGRRMNRPWLVSAFKALSISGAAVLLSWGIGSALCNWQHRKVIAFVEFAHHRLDEIRAKSGSYPTAMPPELAADLPAWLRKPGSYQSDGVSFSISFDDPRAMMFGRRIYSSVDRRWQYID